MGVGYGFNYREGSHDLVACSYASAVRLGLPSRRIVWSLVHETLLPVSGVWVFRLTPSTTYRILYWTGDLFFSPSQLAPENLASQDGFGGPIPRQPAHSPRSGNIWNLLAEFLPFSPTTSTQDTANRHRVSPEFIRSRTRVSKAFTAESPPA